MSNSKHFILLLIVFGMLSSCNDQEFQPTNEIVKSTEDSSKRSAEESILLNIDAEPFASEVISEEFSDEEINEIIEDLYSQNPTENSVIITLNPDPANQQANITLYTLSDDQTGTYPEPSPAVKIYCNYSTGMSDCFAWYRHGLNSGCCMSSVTSTGLYSGTVWMDC